MKIGLSIALAFLLVGCGDEAPKEEVTKHVTEVKKEVVKPTPIAEKATHTVETVVKAVTPTNETVEQVKETVVNKVDDVKKEIVKVSENSVDVVKDVTTTVVEKTQSVTADVVEKTQAIVADVIPTNNSVDGSVVFKACAGCHGADASKKALGKSQVIAGWDVSKVSDALHGYKAGTYGGAMKGLMKGQVSKLSDEDIKAVAEYISTK